MLFRSRNRLPALAEKAKDIFLEQYKKAVAWVRREEKNLSLSKREEQAIYYNYGNTIEQGRELDNSFDRDYDGSK